MSRKLAGQNLKAQIKKLRADIYASGSAPSLQAGMLQDRGKLLEARNLLRSEALVAYVRDSNVLASIVDWQ